MQKHVKNKLFTIKLIKYNTFAHVDNKYTEHICSTSCLPRYKSSKQLDRGTVCKDTCVLFIEL